MKKILVRLVQNVAKNISQREDSTNVVPVALSSTGTAWVPINIRSKYLGCLGVPVVGVMATPLGVRFRPHLQCSSESQAPPGTVGIPAL